MEYSETNIFQVELIIFIFVTLILWLFLFQVFKRLPHEHSDLIDRSKQLKDSDPQLSHAIRWREKNFKNKLIWVTLLVSLSVCIFLTAITTATTTGIWILPLYMILFIDMLFFT